MNDLLQAGQRRARMMVLLGLALLALRTGTLAERPEAVPAGFVRQDIKELRATILRPETWLWRTILPAVPFYNFSPEPFQGPFGVDKGVAIHVMVNTGEPADERVAKLIAGFAAQPGVLRGWTRKNTPAEPFTTYGLVCVLQNEDTDGVKTTCEVVYVANRLTNTVYQCWLVAPTDRWKDVEQTGETMLASLRPDPKF